MIALNDVGGSPDVFGISQQAFYQWAREIHRKWPRTMLATSTHDTKRSEDARARLFVLSEIPGLWSDACREWSEIGRQYRSGEFPDSNLEYHLYQVIAGAWPIEKDRIIKYAEKAAREAKVYTSGPNQMRSTKPGSGNSLTGSTAIPVLPRDRGIRHRNNRTRPCQLACTDADQTDRAGGSGFLPGLRAVGPFPGRSG